eukprot:m.150442 g.150442  ORF g.150442 m.150442 type:complete len:57 (+) comp13283_c0_seq8:88-258(+)
MSVCVCGCVFVFMFVLCFNETNMLHLILYDGPPDSPRVRRRSETSTLSPTFSRNFT